MSKKAKTQPLPVKRALTKLGNDLKSARIIRGLPMSLMAERAFISRITLSKIEKGDPSVAIASYATVLFILGMIDRLSQLVDIRADHFGLGLIEDKLPKRIRRTRSTSL